MYNEAIRDLRKAASLSSEPDFKASTGYAYAKLGDKAAARAVLSELESLAREKRDSFGEALIYTALGDEDRAFKRLQEACDERNYWITTIKILVAIATTKIPMLSKAGFWGMMHEARTDYCMLLGLIFLLIVGSGTLSLDARLSRQPDRPIR